MNKMKIAKHAGRSGKPGNMEWSWCSSQGKLPCESKRAKMLAQLLASRHSTETELALLHSSLIRFLLWSSPSLQVVSCLQRWASNEWIGAAGQQREAGLSIWPSLLSSPSEWTPAEPISTTLTSLLTNLIQNAWGKLVLGFVLVLSLCLALISPSFSAYLPSSLDPQVLSLHVGQVSSIHSIKHLPVCSIPKSCMLSNSLFLLHRPVSKCRSLRSVDPSRSFHAHWLFSFDCTHLTQSGNACWEVSALRWKTSRLAPSL